METKNYEEPASTQINAVCSSGKPFAQVNIWGLAYGYWKTPVKDFWKGYQECVAREQPRPFSLKDVIPRRGLSPGEAKGTASTRLESRSSWAQSDIWSI